jgi:uncharacterized protein YkwD
MVVSARGVSVAISVAVVIALPGTLLLAHRHTEKPQRATALRILPYEPAHDWISTPARVQPTPIPTPTPAPPAVAPPAVRMPAPAAPRPVPPAPPAIGSQQQALINGDRTGAGLSPLVWNPCLAGIAYQNAGRMAAQGYISHTNGPRLDLGCHLGNRAGENVGYTSGGVNDSQLNTLFVNSPEHRANIMGPYHFVGTSWVVAPNGYGYVAVEFG